jgi:nitroimidazol reductase NimA-like FMN-containing flavoprotein (pyridoxamine 5'-phosphate oxidase superfamily)
MFRAMGRIKQQISGEECIRVLKEQPRGVLSMIGDEGYPYGIPLNHLYMDDGHIYFHCGKHGHKIDAIAKCDKVSYCVYDQGYRRDGEWALNISSVIVFGRIREVTDEDRMREICTLLTKKFTDDDEYLQRELRDSFKNVKCLELIPEHMTGKLVNEA